MGVDIEGLYEQYSPILAYRAQSILGEEQEAWDAVHDVFVRLLSGGAENFRGDSAWMTYLYAITTRVCLNKLRARSAKDRAISRQMDPPQVLLGADDASEFCQRLWIALQREFCNPDRLWEVAVYSFIYGMKDPEISQAMGTSKRTVKRDRKQLRDFVRGDPSLSIFEPQGVGEREKDDGPPMRDPEIGVHDLMGAQAPRERVDHE